MLVGMELRLGYAVLDPVLDTVVADILAAVDTLDGSRRRAAGEVEALLHTGWRGAAAESFTTAWQEWLEGADQVNAALEAIVASLEITRREVTLADAGVTAEARHLLERLG